MGKDPDPELVKEIQDRLRESVKEILDENQRISLEDLKKELGLDVEDEDTN